MRRGAIGPLFEEEALRSPPREGGRIEHNLPPVEGIYGPFSGLRLVSMTGDLAVLRCEGAPPGLGETLALREGEKKILLQVIGMKVDQGGRFILAKVRSPCTSFLPSFGAKAIPEAPPLPRGPGIILGKTLDGRPFLCPGRALEKVNLIVGAKGSGKSHLAKVILLSLIRKKAPALVLDINREYGGLPGVRVLRVGKDFKLGIRALGVEGMNELLEAFDTPAASLLHFENGLTELLRERDFIGIEELVELARKGKFYPTFSQGADAVNRTLCSRLTALKETGILASSPFEASSFDLEWERIREGGAISFDLSSLTSPGRRGFTQALLRFLFKKVEEEERFPFIFFEEAHFYVPQTGIDALVTRARHLGITSFFITNSPTALPESVLRSADNLFLFHLPLEEDLRWVGKSALIDFSSLSSLNSSLPRHGCLVIGEVTGGYPAIFIPDPLEGYETRGKTKYFFSD